MSKTQKLGVVVFLIGIPMYYVVGDYNMIFGFISGLLLGDYIWEKAIKLINQPKEEGKCG